MTKQPARILPALNPEETVVGILADALVDALLQGRVKAMQAARRVTLTREQLYDEMWAEPVAKVAERYGKSTDEIARICRRLDVPVPKRAHWRLVSLGRRPERAPLPPPRRGTWPEHVIYVSD